MDCKLSDVEEGVLIGDAGVQGKQFRQCPLHEAYEGEGTGRGELAVSHIHDVHLLQDGTKEGFLLVPADFDEYQEGQDPQRFFTRAPQNYHPLRKRYITALPGLEPCMASRHASVEPILTLLSNAALKGLRAETGSLGAVEDTAGAEQVQAQMLPLS